MRVQSKIDTYDVFAYLLPGLTTVVSLIIIIERFSPESLTKIIESTSTVNQVILFSIAIGISLIVGQINSQFTRVITRKIIWFLSPKNEPLYVNFHGDIQECLLNKIEKVLLITTGKEKIINRNDGIMLEHIYQILISKFVYNKVLSTDIDHHRDIRNRSLIGNSVAPMLLLSIGMAVNGLCLYSFILAIMSVVLLKRQADLDLRIWKEIYIALLAIPLNDLESIDAPDQTT